MREHKSSRGSTGQRTFSRWLFAEQRPIRARDLDDLGIPRTYLRRLSERGLLEQVDRGLYRLANAPATEHHSIPQVAVRVANATVCLLTALHSTS